jgi:pilus assembly protein CpaF
MTIRTILESRVRPKIEYRNSDRFDPNLRNDFASIKGLLHSKLLDQIDLATIENMNSSELKEQIEEGLLLLVSSLNLVVSESDVSKLISAIQNELIGLGPLELLIADPSISDILINNAFNIFVERKGVLERSKVQFDNNAHLLKIIQKIASRIGRRIDESNPMVDARLPDGSRVNAIIPPLALDGPSMSIRRFSVVPLTMSNLVKGGALTEQMALVLAALVKAKINILIAGGTGSGKTTLLNILSGYIPENERIITIEDAAELRLQQPHVVRLETRQANIEGQGGIDQRSLLHNCLRMRPDRIVLGEIRGAEVLDMLQAMNTGHDGSLTTIHANSAREAVVRIENMVGMAGVTAVQKSLRQQIASAISIVIHISRLSDGQRKITSISEIVGMEGDMVSMQDIFVFNQRAISPSGAVLGEHIATGIRLRLADKLATRGAGLDEHLFFAKT